MPTDINTILSWFKTGLKPTQAQFWASWQSFWHKDEQIPQSSIANLSTTLNAKAEKSQFDAHIVDPNAHADSIGQKLDRGGYAGTAKNIDDRISIIENPNRVLRFGFLTIEELNLTIASNAFAWVLNNVTFFTPESFTATITEATAGMYRTDIVVGNQIGGYEIVEGVEAITGEATAEPPAPAGTIKLGFISVFGATIAGSGSVPAIEKLNIADNDRINIDNSENLFKEASVKWTTIKTALKAFFDVFYLGTSNDQTVSGVKIFLAGKLGLRNVANTFTSSFTNSNTASRTYTLQNRDGILLDNTDLTTINSSLATKQSVFTGTTNYLSKSLNSTTLSVSRLFDDGSFFGIGTVKTPLKDISLGYQTDRVIGIEQSDGSTIGRNLSIEAGRTINFSDFNSYISLNQVNRLYSVISNSPSGNMFATVFAGDIYKQTAGSGHFVALGGTTRYWSGICAAPNGDIYAAVGGGMSNNNHSGDIYKQTGGVGAFNALNQSILSWAGMCAAPNGDIYAAVGGGFAGGVSGDIYKQTGGTGNFVALGQTSRVWQGMFATSNGDIFAVVRNGDIYKQTEGIGNFIALGQTSRLWNSIVKLKNGDFIAATGFGGNVGDIYKQTNGIGPFVLIDEPRRNYNGLGTNNGIDMYAVTFGGDIYKQTNQSLGTANLDGGKLVLKSGTGKGTGQSRIEITTGQKTISGTDMQLEVVRMLFDESGNVTLPTLPIYASNSAAITGGLTTNMIYKTTIGEIKIVY